MLRFVILAAPRTGSNLLCTLLDSHPEILCHHELFNPQGVFTALSCRSDGRQWSTVEERDRDPLGFLERLWSANPAYDCVGFKWTRGQNEMVMWELLQDPRVKKIVLRRRNRIKTYISEQIAQRTQQWEVYDERELVPRPQVTVTVADLQFHMRSNDAFYADLRSSLDTLHQPYLEVTYELLFTREEQRRILDFLCVAEVDAELKAASVKQNSTDLSDSIANFAELAESLSSSGLTAELFDRDL